MRPRRWKYSGSELKKRILEGLIDKENKCKVSDREFLRTKSSELTVDGKSCYTGVYTYIVKHPEIINSQPMKGERICEETVYKYAIQKGYWTEDEVPYDDFTNNTMKIRDKLNDETLMRSMCNELGYPTKPLNEGVFNVSEIEETLIYIHGEDKYNKVKKLKQKELLKR